MIDVPTSLRRRGAVLLWSCLCVLVSAVAAADTAQDVSKAQGLLDRAQVNLDNVQQNLAGRSGPPRGSAGKLLARRLQQAFDDLKPAGELVQQLPAGGEGVAEVTARYNQAVALYGRLAQIMNPDAAAGPAAEADAPSGGRELGYPHADNFKNAQFTLQHKVEAPANQITQLHARLLPMPNQLTIDHREVAGGLELIAETRRQAGFVDTALASIPADGRGVPEAKDRLAAARETLDGAEAYFQPLLGQILATIDPAKFPDAEADRLRLRGLSRDYAQDYVFTSDRARAAELFVQMPAAQEEIVRLAKLYQPHLQQRTGIGEQIENAGNSALNSLKAFAGRIETQKQELPDAIRADLAEADRMAQEAVANQKPLWFTGGVPQHTDQAADKLALLTAIDPATAEPLNQAYQDLQASIAQRADSLKELIIRENAPPPDNFQGEDREAAVEIARSGWAVQQPDAEVLAIRIPAEAWRRETKWTYSNGTWYHVDRSKLQVRLLVADPDNPELAIDRPVTVIKDHQAGDSMIGVPLRNIEEALQPSEYLLRSKLN